jgi:hypothetical protein
MSQDSATTPGRDAVDRLLVRFPRLFDWMLAALGRMRSGSALRRRLLSLSVKRAFDAIASSDLDLVLQRYDPSVEVWMRGMSGVGGPGGCYRGHEGVRAIYAEVDESSASGGGGSAPWSTVVIVSPSARTSSVSDAAAESRRP